MVLLYGVFSIVKATESPVQPTEEPTAVQPTEGGVTREDIEALVYLGDKYMPTLTEEQHADNAALNSFYMDPANAGLLFTEINDAFNAADTDNDGLLADFAEYKNFSTMYNQNHIDRGGHLPQYSEDDEWLIFVTMQKYTTDQEGISLNDIFASWYDVAKLKAAQTTTTRVELPLDTFAKLKAWCSESIDNCRTCKGRDRDDGTCKTRDRMIAKCRTFRSNVICSEIVGCSFRIKKNGKMTCTGGKHGLE